MFSVRSCVFEFAHSQYQTSRIGRVRAYVLRQYQCLLWSPVGGIGAYAASVPCRSYRRRRRISVLRPFSTRRIPNISTRRLVSGA
eukprot:3942002-Rhodomonas_salina.2